MTLFLQAIPVILKWLTPRNFLHRVRTGIYILLASGTLRCTDRRHLFLGLWRSPAICRHRAGRRLRRCGLLIWISEGVRGGEGPVALIKTPVSPKVSLRVVSKWKSKYCWPCPCPWVRRAGAKAPLLPRPSEISEPVLLPPRFACRTRLNEPSYSSKLEYFARTDIERRKHEAVPVCVGGCLDSSDRDC